MIVPHQFVSPIGALRLTKVEVFGSLVPRRVNLRYPIKTAPTHLGSKVFQRMPGACTAAKGQRNDMLWYAILNRGPRNELHCGRIMLDVGVQKLDYITRHPGISNDRIL